MENTKTRTLVLTLRIDYETDGRDVQDMETAARLVIAQQYPTIENGVRIRRVAVAREGLELYHIDADDTGN